MVSTERSSDSLGVGARIKIAPMEQFLTQVTLLLACELVRTTRNKRYECGDRSELVSRRRTYEQEQVSLSAPLKNPPFMGDFLMVSTERTSDPLGVGARIKIAPVE
jgi:hypothetical protein